MFYGLGENIRVPAPACAGQHRSQSADKPGQQPTEQQPANQFGQQQQELI